MIELHYWPTPNGHKVTLLLEELAEAGAPLAYRIVPVDIGKGAQFEPAFLAQAGTLGRAGRAGRVAAHRPRRGEGAHARLIAVLGSLPLCGRRRAPAQSFLVEPDAR